jgi:hypothetical protein
MKREERGKREREKKTKITSFNSSFHSLDDDLFENKTIVLKKDGVYATYIQ